jgi:hypothetical protein
MPRKDPLDKHLICGMKDVLSVNWIEIALRETEIVHRVEHIRFANTIGPQETIHRRTEAQIGLRVIFKVQ